MKFLFVKPSSFGDITHLFPTLALLHSKYPSAILDFVVNPNFVQILDYSPFPVRRKIIFERHKLADPKTFFPELFSLYKEIHRERYDVAIDFQGLMRSGLCLAFSRARIRCGFAEPKEKFARIFYNRTFHVQPKHAVERYYELANYALGPFVGELAQSDLPVNQVNLPELPPRYIVLLPGTRWKSKKYPVQLFSAIVKRITQEVPGISFVICGDKGERFIGDAISGEKIINLTGETSINQLFEILRNAVAVVGNDSGPLHAAAALKKPVIGFYGSTLPELTGPWGENVRTFSANVDCLGCLQHECPYDNYRCWNLNVDDIVEYLKQVITKTQ